MIRVLVADDSFTIRAQLVRLLREDPEIMVVGEAKDGVDAVAAARRVRPDVIVMDVMMPRLDGFEATKRIMFDTPTPVVMVSSTFTSREVSMSLEALRAGAVHVLPKPSGPGSEGFEEEARRFVRTVKAMSQVKVVRRWPDARPVSEPAASQSSSVARTSVAVRIVAMAASTGGPAAIHRILSELPAEFGAPILVVQHIAGGFAEDFARWLDAGSRLRVKLAEEGEPLVSGTVYVAPPDNHLGVRRTAVALSTAPPIAGFRPSATHMFESVAQAYGPASLALVLTGMGRDGVDGLKSIRDAGGAIVTQDEATSAIFGMPGAAAEAGLAGDVLPLDAIASHLVRALEPRG